MAELRGRQSAIEDKIESKDMDQMEELINVMGDQELGLLTNDPKADAKAYL